MFQDCITGFNDSKQNTLAQTYKRNSEHYGTILRQIANEISGKWYTVMVDETTNLSNTEQMILCLRHVDDNLEVHEDDIGLYRLDSTSADTIFSTIQDVLLHLNHTMLRWGKQYVWFKVWCSHQTY